MSRHNMFIELATDQVNQVQQLLDEGRYQEVHDLLQPIFLEIVRADFAEFNDEDLKAHYAEQMGIDLPNV